MGLHFQLNLQLTPSLIRPYPTQHITLRSFEFPDALTSLIKMLSMHFGHFDDALRRLIPPSLIDPETFSRVRVVAIKKQKVTFGDEIAKSC